jgi:Zn-dependent metalloprotease
VKNERDELGHQHLRFSQHYKGLPLWPSQLGAHFDQAGTLSSVDGAYVATPELDSIKPTLSSDEAVAFAKPRSEGTPQPQTRNWCSLTNRWTSTTRVEFELTASLLESWLVLVDAADGSVLHRSPLVCDVRCKARG